MPDENQKWPLVVVGIIAVALTGYAYMLGTRKVNNELQMTVEYNRQAAALERIAAHLDGKKDAASCSASSGDRFLNYNAKLTTCVNGECETEAMP